MNTAIIIILTLVQFGMAVMYFKKLLGGFKHGEASFASIVCDRVKTPGKYWGLMAFYSVCVFATLLIGMLLMSLL